MKKADVQNIYEALFASDDNSLKARAFDKIAGNYYMGNFGSMQKSDFETLMFSLYLDRLLEKDTNDFSSYSDYRLSKILGITQAKVANLKIKKELKYPYEKLDWKKSFLSVIGNAHVEDGKIKINIPDVNLYLEIKNAIEEKGGYVDVVLNSRLLQTNPATFLDILVDLADAKHIERLKNEIVKKLKDDNASVDFLTTKSFSEQMRQFGINFGIESLAQVLEGAPFVGSALGNSVKDFLKILSVHKSNKKISKKIKPAK